MRFVWAVVAFVLAALMIGLGIAQRTVFQGPRSEGVSLTAAQPAPFVLVDAEVLQSKPGTQTVTATGPGQVVVAFGRTPDVTAWLAGTGYDQVTLGDAGQPVTTRVAAAPVADPAVVSHDPLGSDLWLDQFSADGTVTAPLQLPTGMSLLIASDGTAPAPQASVEWPSTAATPWSGPLLVGGGILLVVGVVLYILAIRHARRSRGPRRKAPPPLPTTEPISLAEIEAAEAKGVISASPDAKKSIRGRRSFVAIPLVLAGAVALAGCSADSWPQFGSTPTPTPTASVIVPENQQRPAVTQEQAARIIQHASETIAAADAAMNADLAATRLDGPALAVRKTNYTLRGKLPDYAAPAAIPTHPIEIVLPQAINGWPRTVMAVVKQGDDATVAPAIMFLTQANPWADYRISYLANLEAAATLPDLAPAYVGASQVPPDSTFLLLPPNQVAAAYADVLTNGDKSPYYDLFDIESDQFRVGIAQDRQKRLDAFNQTASSTGSLTFGASAGTAPPIALATVDSGAIVAVDVHETDTVKPTNADAVIKFEGNDTVKTLTGVDQSKTGVTSTFSDQLVFSVPSQGSGDKIKLIGYLSAILDAKVIP